MPTRQSPNTGQREAEQSEPREVQVSNERSIDCFHSQEKLFGCLAVSREEVLHLKFSTLKITRLPISFSFFPIADSDVYPEVLTPILLESQNKARSDRNQRPRYGTDTYLPASGAFRPYCYHRPVRARIQRIPSGVLSISSRIGRIALQFQGSRGKTSRSKPALHGARSARPPADLCLAIV